MRLTNIFICIVFTFLVAINNLNLGGPAENHWAVLVSGSDGWYNYRHQADVCHAYHILIRNGVPKDHIIVFSVDDAKDDSSNPFPGKLFNHPDPTGPGINVRQGCEIDYTGDDVTPDNFLKVITGDKAGMKNIGKGKVLESTENDFVFINFVDHGAEGLIAFPKDELYAPRLMKNLKKMHEKKLYKKLVFYLEACESGSMVENILPENLGIYVVTAANSEESSYATYCDDPYDVINGTSLENCLGDLFSVNWMENTDLIDNTTETLKEQYSVVKEQTDLSHVLQWGDKTFTGDSIKEFMGNESTSYYKYLKNYLFSYFNSTPQFDEKLKQLLKEGKRRGSIDSRDVEHTILKRKSEKQPQNQIANSKHLDSDNRRSKLNMIFYQFRSKYEIPANAKNYFTFNRPVNKCYKEVIKFFKTKCAVDRDYSLGFYKYFYSACIKGVNQDEMKSELEKYCTSDFAIGLK